MSRVAGMAMDEQAAKSDVQGLGELLDSTASKSKKHKDKADEYWITFKHLEKFPYVMMQTAWELDWDKVQGLYDLCISIPTFIIDNAIIDEWSPTASSSGAQQWTRSNDLDTHYTHAVLLSLTPLSPLDLLQGREQGNYRSSPKQFVYSAVVIYIHPGQTLSTIGNAVGFFKHQYNTILQGSHSNGWYVLCKLPHYETSQFFVVIPWMPYLVLPVSESSDPTVQPQLCLDSACCKADRMIVQLLHHMWHHDMDYAMIPPVLRPNVEVPLDTCMEEFPKLWQNTTYRSWKAGCPSEEVGIAMTLVSTNHREFDSQRLVVDISDAMTIWYPALNVDEDSGGDSTVVGHDIDDNKDDINDKEDLDEELQKMVMEVANKTDDSGFRSGVEDNPRIEVLVGSSATWTNGTALSYPLKLAGLSSSSQEHSNVASWCGAVSGPALMLIFRRMPADLALWS